jgi:hypothetical protein
LCKNISRKAAKAQRKTSFLMLGDKKLFFGFLGVFAALREDKIVTN